MSRFTLITSLFSQTVSRTPSPRRRACLRLELLEGRDLMSVIPGPSVSPPPPGGTLPPIVVPPSHDKLPPSYL
jgi:hypothetical protein